MYTRSYRKPVPPVPPPDYSGTALSDAAVPPPAPSSAAEKETGVQDSDDMRENTEIPLPSAAVPVEKPLSGLKKEITSFGSDDWLLLGLIFLFLTGSAEEVKDQLVLLVLLGVLFFTGRGGFPLFG